MNRSFNLKVFGLSLEEFLFNETVVIILTKIGTYFLS